MFNTLKSLSIDGIVLKRLSINGVLSWEESSRYTNRVPVSIDENGNIFNGVGYQESLRLSSSGVTKEKNNSVVTGFIPVKGGDTVRIVGVNWSYASSSNYICAYDSSFTFLYAGTSAGGYYLSTMAESVTFDGEMAIIKLAALDNIAYIRFSSCGDDTKQAQGSEMIVTINEEIV